MRRVEGFLPSLSGLHFPNSFDHVPLRTIEIPLVGTTVELGDAAHGLCGGMVFAARDYFEAGQGPPAATTPPRDGPLFEYLVQRLFDSWDIPRGIARYLHLMSPELPDFGLGDGLARLIGRSRAWIMIRDEWPRIQRDIDANRPSPLGLVNCKSADPAHLGQNHQVLAYGYDLGGTDLTLAVYDPNVPDDDTVRISLSLASPDESCPARLHDRADAGLLLPQPLRAAAGPPRRGGASADRRRGWRRAGAHLLLAPASWRRRDRARRRLRLRARLRGDARRGRAERVGDCLEDEHATTRPTATRCSARPAAACWSGARPTTGPPSPTARRTWINGPHGLESRPNADCFWWEACPAGRRRRCRSRPRRSCAATRPGRG